jgi:hypothetical protein
VFSGKAMEFRVPMIRSRLHPITFEDLGSAIQSSARLFAATVDSKRRKFASKLPLVEEIASPWDLELNFETMGALHDAFWMGKSCWKQSLGVPK